MSAVSQSTAVRSGEVNGIEYKLLLSPLRWGVNGYVHLSEGHPWRGLDYDAVPADVHGGLTYSDEEWIGFDTMHAFDVWTVDAIAEAGGEPFPRPGARSEYDTFWTLTALETETRRLALQACVARDEVSA